MSIEEDLALAKIRDLEVRVAKLERGTELRTFETPQRSSRQTEEQPAKVEEFGSSEEDEEDDYSEWTVAELRQELEERKLGIDGRKAELVERLLADDSKEE